MTINVIPFTYEGNNIRTIEHNGHVLFCGRDVAQTLGYTNTKDALSRHCRGVVNYYPLETAGGIQRARFISEGDLYRLITHSKLENAQKFETWVFDEVLPAVRRHGMYATQEAVEAFLANPDALYHTLTALKEEREKNAALQRQAMLNAPKVLFADAVTSSASTILVGELAKILKGKGINMGQNRMFAWLRENGYLMKRRGTSYNMPTQRSMELGLFEIKESTVPHGDGHIAVHKTTKVTGKGQQYFINLFLGKEHVA